MDIATIVETGAAVASTPSFAPQAVKIIRTGKTKDISFWMYVLTVSAFALWTVYGIMTRQWPLLCANVVCLCLSGFILSMKTTERRTQRNSPKDSLE
jgi:MtN3 and saliva related transmembrane protein